MISRVPSVQSIKEIGWLNKVGDPNKIAPSLILAATARSTPTLSILRGMETLSNLGWILLFCVGSAFVVLDWIF